MKLNSLVLVRCHIQVRLLRLPLFTCTLDSQTKCFLKFRGPKLGCALDSVTHQICVNMVYISDIQQQEPDFLCVGLEQCTALVETGQPRQCSRWEMSSTTEELEFDSQQWQKCFFSPLCLLCLWDCLALCSLDIRILFLSQNLPQHEADD